MSTTVGARLGGWGAATAAMTLLSRWSSWRFLGLMEQEFITLVSSLALILFANAVLTWRFRYSLYERYLRLKYRVKNKIIHPIVFRNHEKHHRMA